MAIDSYDKRRGERVPGETSFLVVGSWRGDDNWALQQWQLRDRVGMGAGVSGTTGDDDMYGRDKYRTVREL